MKIEEKYYNENEEIIKNKDNIISIYINQIKEENKIYKELYNKYIIIENKI